MGSKGPIMMATEAPLNLAHQQDRKAERYLNVGRFQDAISCHQRAAEYIQEAMKKTAVKQALSSLELQYESHLKQQKIIQEKERRHEVIKKINATKLDELKVALNGHKKAEVDDVDGSNGIVSNGVDNVNNNPDPIVRYSKRTMETDSLLQFLNGNSIHNPLMEESTAFILASTREFQSPFSNMCSVARSNGSTPPTEIPEPENEPALTTSDSKVLQDNKDIIQELQTQNELLKDHILKLTKAWESCEKENDELRESVYDLNRQLEELRSHGITTRQTDISNELNAPFSNPMTGLVEPPPDDLPPLAPLELPDFNFDINKVGSSPPPV
ncbi:uncharacterized protein LOC144446380 [Glandiceps talaboti]